MPYSFSRIMAASCALFSSILCYNTSFFSVPRLLNLSLSISQDGGSKHKTSAFPNRSFSRVFLISFIPYRSTSISGILPVFEISKYDCLLVPYQLVKTRLFYSIYPLSARVENSSLLIKQQCFPSISPCLGGRVVKLRTNWKIECLLRREDMTVPFPTPEGPITISDFIQQSLIASLSIQLDGMARLFLLFNIRTTLVYILDLIRTVIITPATLQVKLKFLSLQGVQC